MNVIAFFSALLFMASSVLNAQSFKVFAVSDLSRVFEDGYKLPVKYDTIKVFGIRGEILSGQFVVNAKSNLTNLTVELSALKNHVSGNSLPTSSVEWNFVGTIPLTANTRGYPLTLVTRKAPANFPEYLMEERQININKGDSVLTSTREKR